MANLQQRSPAWHEARRGKLTASNLGAALGQVSYISRAQAFRRAMGTEVFTGNVATEWGTNNEPNGILAYQAATGNLVQPTGLHVSSKHNWFAGSPDGLVGTEGMVEIKCPFYFKRDGSGRLHKSIPGHYFLQINALLEITDRNWCDYVCWAPEGMAIYRAYRDPELLDFLMPFYGQFYAAVQAQAKGPPPLSSYDRAAIKDAIEASMAAKVKLDYYSNVDRTASLPEVEYSSDEEPLSKRSKRKRLEISDDVSNHNESGDILHTN